MAKVTWKLAMGRTWRGKLEESHPNHGKVCPIPPRFQRRLGKGTMLIPRPIDVDALMRMPKKGELVTVSQIRGKLARMAGADSTCPLTTGIFMRIAAETAEEDRRAGKKRITPYWRPVKDDGRLMEKFPGGSSAQAPKLRREGVDVQKRRKSLRIPSFESRYLHL